MEKKYMDFIKKAHSLLKKYYWVLLIILLFLIAMETMTTIVVVLAMILIGAFSTYYKRVLDFSIGFELVTFFTIVFYFVFGPFFAIIAAIIMTVLAHLLTGRMDVNMFIRMGCYTLVCIFSIIFLKEDIVSFGKIFVISFNALLFVIYGYMYPYSIPSGILVVTVNILLNFFLIEKLGLLLVGLL